MSKLLGGLGLCFALSAVPSAFAQDPFTVPNYEPAPMDAGPVLTEFPAPVAELEKPIIQATPADKAEPQFNDAPLKSRTQNAHVRSARTPAQEYIYKRATFEAQQRTLRMEQRKWRGESLLRPDNHTDHSWWYEYSVPVWMSSYRK